MFCYLVRRISLSKLINAVTPIPYKLLHVDHQLREYYQQRYIVYYLTNRIAIHDDNFTSERDTINQSCTKSILQNKSRKSIRGRYGSK